jgi:hypothetical protein
MLATPSILYVQTSGVVHAAAAMVVIQIPKTNMLS